MFGFIKYSIAFITFFIILSIPLQEKPLFNHLNDVTRPITQAIISKVEYQTLKAITGLKEFGKKLFSNATPVISDSVNVTRSAIERGIKKLPKPEKLMEVKNSVWEIEEEATTQTDPEPATESEDEINAKFDKENHSREDQKKLEGLLKSDS